jgi:hypothetical protein
VAPGRAASRRESNHGVTEWPVLRLSTALFTPLGLIRNMGGNLLKLSCFPGRFNLNLKSIAEPGLNRPSRARRPASSWPAGAQTNVTAHGPWWPCHSHSASGRLPHGIYHPKSDIYHLRYTPWYMQNRKMIYIMVYTIAIQHGVYHEYHGIYHLSYHFIYHDISYTWVYTMVYLMVYTLLCIMVYTSILRLVYTIVPPFI